MPQITLEFTDNLELPNCKTMMKEIHKILAENLPTSLDHCKSRMIKLTDYCVGEDPKASFLHLEIRLLPGRSSEVIRKTSDLVKKCLKSHLGDISLTSVSLVFTELSTTYTKL